MQNYRNNIFFGILLLFISINLLAQPGDLPPVPRAEWGAPVVEVTQHGNDWIITGQKHQVVLNHKDLSLSVKTGAVTWAMIASADDDMILKSKGEEFSVGLTEAGNIAIEPYDTGYKTGIKITLSRFRHEGMLHQGIELDLMLFLTICLEGKDEELVYDAAALENETVVRQLDWPKQMDMKGIDYTVLSNRKGTLLPTDWPKAYSPIRNILDDGSIDPRDVSVVESNLIECWSMAWWGFQKGKSAMMIIVETSDDAAYKFDHPAGGPTVMGPRWRCSLGALRYPRSLRMCFFDKGNYVTLAKRYRKYVMDSGHFVSLKEKVAREPLVRELIGTPHIRLHILKNVKQDCYRYDKENLDRNYHLTTFDETGEKLQNIKDQGIDRLYVCIAGWPYLGYDRQHPDALPVSPQAGGYEGMKRLAETMEELGYLFVPHEQYRDYYTDAPSYQTQFAVHDEDNVKPPMRFPSTRFGHTTKTGYVPFMDYWEGGEQTYLSPSFMPGHLKKNYQLLFDHGIQARGAYLDVFGYVPPDEDFNPEHPATRRDNMNYRAACYRWVRNNLGLVGTEAAADWVIPYVDFGSANPGLGRAIPVPLYELVYHDAIVSPFNSGSQSSAMIGMLYGGVPQIWGRDEISEENLALIQKMAALHARIGLLEMVNHEFVDDHFRKERTTFSDGTTVTVDHDAGTVEVVPSL